ncbi:MAG: hypothetical protein ABH896_02645 [Candidatus Jacksonbacteria bacterium]
MLETLTKNHTVSLTSLGSAKNALKDIARFVDKNGATCGYFFSVEMLEDILEDMESMRPRFWAELESSRSSGRIPGREIEKELGI